MLLDGFLRGVRRTVLPNGLTVLTNEDRSGVVAITTWVKAGYFHEPDEVAGMAHLFEHMFFKGSERFPGAEEISTHVSALGGTTNAGTIYDSTHYYFVLPREGFAKGVEIQADAIRHPLFDPGELVREAEVVIEESNRKLDNPTAVAVERMYATAFTRHRIRRWRIGSNEVLRNIRRDDLVAFFETLYRPENIIVSIAGDVPHDEAIATVARTFGELPVGTFRKERGPAEPPQDMFRFGESTADLNQSTMVFGWHVPGEGDPDAEALELLSTILGGGRTSRLFRYVVGSKGADSASAWTTIYEDVGMFTILATSLPDRVGDVESAIVEEVERLRRAGPTAFELQLAKNRLEAGLVFALEDVLGQSETLAWFESRGDYRDLGAYLERLEKVSSEDVLRVAAEHLRLDGATLFRHVPRGFDGGERTGILAALDRATKGVEERAEPEIEVPDPPRFVESASAETPIRVETTSDRIGVIVRQRPSRPLVSIFVGFEGGRIDERSSEAGITLLMARAMRRGTANRTAEEIDREIEFLGSDIRIAVDDDYFGFETSVLRDRVAAAIDLLADLVTNPTFPEDGVDRERDLQKAAIRRARDSSTIRPFQLFFQAFFGDHPYGRPGDGTEESLDRLTREKLHSWWSRVVTRERATVVVVGDVDTDAIVGEIEATMGRLRSGGGERVEIPEVSLSSGGEVVESRDRKQSAIVVGFPAVPPGHHDWAALRILRDVTSGLAGTFFSELRGKRSLCYTVRAGESSRARAGAFVAYIATEASKEEEAQKALVGEIRRLGDDGFSREDLDRAKAYFAGSNRIRLQTNRAIASEIARNHFLDLGLEFTERLAKAITELDVESVRDVARRYLSGDNETIAILRGSTST